MTTTTDPVTTAAATAARSRGRRLLEGGAVVALWIGVGRLWGLDVIGHLLLGVPVVVGIQLGVRRQPLRELWARDTTTIARSRTGKTAVVAGVTVVIAALVLQSFSADDWIDDSWTVLLMAGALALGYALLRRIFVTVAMAAVLVTVAVWVHAAQLATDANGDAPLLARIDHLHAMGALAGYQDLAIAEVDLDAPQPVRLAGLGATDTTPMEVGSLTKAMTGLVIADAVTRGEVRMDAPLSTYLPQLRGSAAGEVTMHELVTHNAGFANFGADTLRRGLWSAPLGLNLFDTDLNQTIQEIKADGLTTRGSYAYSNLGAAAAGQATAAAVGMSYPDLMRTRLFAPLGMTDTAIQSAAPLVPGGRSASGLLVQPWVAGGDAPAGAAVSTARDLTILATAILDGTAPGLDALQENAPTGRNDTTVGTFWHITTGENGRTITWHNGKTGGYTSYMGLDLEYHRAVIVLSDVAMDVVGVGVALLGQDFCTESASPAGCT